MLDLHYSLPVEDYTWKNAFLWGNFLSHCRKVREGNFSDRFIHILIAAAEFLPIISQIASIFEKIIVNRVHSKKEISKQTKAEKSIFVNNNPEKVELNNRLFLTKQSTEKSASHKIRFLIDTIQELENRNELPRDRSIYGWDVVLVDNLCKYINLKLEALGSDIVITDSELEKMFNDGINTLEIRNDRSYLYIGLCNIDRTANKVKIYTRGGSLPEKALDLKAEQSICSGILKK